MRRQQKFSVVAALVGSILLLGACSMAEFVYDMAPRFALHYVDDYLHLDNRQEAHALQLFRARHAQHASDELPRYHAFLLETDVMVWDGLTRTEVDTVFDTVNALYDLAVERTLPVAAEILASLDAGQLDLLEERLADDAAEDREEMDDDHRGRRIHETLEDIEEWVGPLDDTQRRLLRRELDAMRMTRPLWLEWRIDANARLLALLRERPAPAAIEEFLATRWLRRERLPAELAEGLEENRSRYRDMIVALDATLSTKQRHALHEKLTEYGELVAGMLPDDVRLAMKQGSESGVERERRTLQ